MDTIGFKAHRFGPGPESGGGAREAALSLGILLATPGIVLWYVWWGRFQYRSWLMQGTAYLALLALLAANQWLFGGGLRRQGFRLDNLRASARLVLPATLALAVAVLGYGWWRGQWHPGQWSKIGIYLVWGLLQQYALQNLLLARSRSLLRHTPAAILAASAIFSLMHLPVPELVVFSFLGAALWCWAFSRVPNLWTLGLSHACLGVLLLVSTGQGFKIGTPGFQYDAYGGGVLVAGGHFEDGAPFVATLPGHDEDAASRVRIFSPEGALIREWTAFSEWGFSGNLAVGDLGFPTGDAVAVAPGPGPGNPGTVRIFSTDGLLRADIRVPGGDAFGAYVAIGCGKVYVTPGPAPGEAARVLEYDGSGNLLRQWRPAGLGLSNSVRAFPVGSVAVGGGPPCPERIALYGTPIAANPSTLFLMDPGDGTVRRLAGAATTFGLNAAQFGRRPDPPGVITAPGPLLGYGAHVRIYDARGGEVFGRVMYPDPDPCGSNVSALDVDGDGRDEMLLGEGVCRDAPATVRIFDSSGALLYRWDAYPASGGR